MTDLDAATLDGPSPDARVLDRLFATIDARRGADPASSYTAKLLAGGAPAAAKKLGEEAVEAVIEAVLGRPDRLADESADLLYHLLVLWASAGVSPDAVWTALARREGRSGIAEKAARPPA
ncbi:phosphoribosyl-ATP pyrophosphatase [Stella humosa]|uniref:Phosphoribosyl-ATP pyrophosphatase n=1 Tax=Stella humosa TaxID=94 RepID=A0A3N1LJE4_9PROT|nr:phosphoribosyl-ATP diphosphatase [Stella humosa]ROP90988.1 phosphoribosyl-ATP pyrophosphatase [Stella humosa]BBK34662.1 phosphoribosyl-ATP pyrophosphatase [Stella humosa]